jgi:hypothetical protein
MNEIRARYIQDEREDARKEGKIEERKQVITNMLKETDDINFIHKMTKYPRSEIINVAKLASINIKI